MGAADYSSNRLDADVRESSPDWVKDTDPSLLLMFVHIPKTGGTSLKQALTVAYGRHFADHHLRMNSFHDRSDLDELRAISSHMPYGFQQDFPSIMKRTRVPFAVVRDPVDRLISYYNFVTTFKPHRLFRELKDHAPEEFFEAVFDKRVGEVMNGQCRVIARRESADAAIELMGREFFAVAPLERVAELTELLAKRFGWPAQSSERHANQSPKRLTRSNISPSLLERLEAKNAQDKLLHEFVLGRADLRLNTIPTLRKRNAS